MILWKELSQKLYTVCSEVPFAGSLQEVTAARSCKTSLKRVVRRKILIELSYTIIRYKNPRFKIEIRFLGVLTLKKKKSCGMLFGFMSFNFSVSNTNIYLGRGLVYHGREWFMAYCTYIHFEGRLVYILKLWKIRWSIYAPLPPQMRYTSNFLSQYFLDNGSEPKSYGKVTIPLLLLIFRILKGSSK